MVKLVLTLALVASASALPQFGLDNFISSGDISGGSISSGGSFISGGDSGSFLSSGGDSGFVSGGGSFVSGSGGNFVSGGGSVGGGDARLRGISFDDGCSGGQVRHADGNCVTPEVSTNLFLYAVPAQVARTIPARNLPKPKVHVNHVFVRTENAHNQARPVLGPTPKQKTIVYVLNKRPGANQQEVIEVPHTPTKPEVFVVNFDDESDNRQLAGGIDLQTALRQSLTNAQVIEAGGRSDNVGTTGFTGGSIVDGGSIVGGGDIAVNLRSASDFGGNVGGDIIGGGDFLNSGNSFDQIL